MAAAMTMGTIQMRGAMPGIFQPSQAQVIQVKPKAGEADPEHTANTPFDLTMDAPDLEAIDKRFIAASKFKATSNVNLRNELCARFYRGDQHYYYDMVSGVIRPNDRMRALGHVDNKIKQAVDMLTHKAGSIPVPLEATSGKGQLLGAETASIVTEFLHYCDKKMVWKPDDDEVNVLKQIFGIAYKRLYWDDSVCDVVGVWIDDPLSPPLAPLPSGYEHLGRMPYEGRWIDAYSGPFGFWTVEVVTGDELFVEPGAKRLSSCKSFFSATRRTLAYIYERYGDEIGKRVRPEKVRDLREDGNGAVVWATENTLRQYRAVMERPDGAREFDRQAGLVFEKTFYQKRADGKWDIIAYLKSSENQGLLLEHRVDEHHCWFESRYGHDPDTFWCNGRVWGMIPLQIAVNKIETDALIQQHISSKPIHVGPKAGDAVFSAGAVSHNLETPPGSRRDDYSWEKIPTNIGESIALKNDLAKDLGEASGVQDVSRGRVSANASGKLVENLLSEQQIGPDALQESTTQMNVEMAQVMISMSRKRMTPPRLMNLTSDQYEARLLLSEALPGVVSIKPVASRVFPRTQAGRISAVESLNQMGVFDNPEKGSMVMRAMGAGESDLGSLLPSQQQVKKAVRRDVHDIESGVIQFGPDPSGSEQGAPALPESTNQPKQYLLRNGSRVVQPWMDHQQWLYEINDYRLSDRILTGWANNPEAMRKLEALSDEHQQFLSDAMGAQVETEKDKARFQKQLETESQIAIIKEQARLNAVIRSTDGTLLLEPNMKDAPAPDPNAPPAAPVAPLNLKQSPVSKMSDMGGGGPKQQAISEMSMGQ